MFLTFAVVVKGANRIQVTNSATVCNYNFQVVAVPS